MFLFKLPFLPYQEQNNSRQAQQASKDQPSTPDVRRSPSTSKMASTKEWKYYPIHGIPVKTEGNAPLSPNVKVPVRYNIDKWSREPANDMQVKLFIMALDRFQKIPPRERESYFQVAGIHGQPNVPWDEPLDKADTAGRGYCTHNNILFPVWHRAYLALYEVINPV